jgi:acetamidase/formamidase
MSPRNSFNSPSPRNHPHPHAACAPANPISPLGIGRLKRLAAAAFLSASFAAAAGAMEVPYDYYVHCTPENAIFGYFSATKAPVITVPSGAVVRIDGGGGNKWSDKDDPDTWLAENKVGVMVETSPALQEIVRAIKESKSYLPPPPGSPAGARFGGHFLIGPIYIEDAEPGDSLEVRILDVTPRLPYGSNGARPGGGTLPDLTPRPYSKVYMLDLKRNTAIFDSNIEVPLAPFNGVNATCPPDSEGPNRRSTRPGVFGGNLDSKDLTTGSTLYLPIFQKGALFYTGDCHAAQGDGEVAGDAIGTANTVVYQFILHKGKTLKQPRAETPTAYITYGMDPDLNKAMKNALVESLAFLKEKQGIDFLPAYSLASAAIDFHVTQTVDQTLGVDGVISKKLFINDPNTYWYRTARF